jgi:hypothetical protein
MCCRTRTGRSADSWSVSAGLDYPAVGPEHAHLKDSGRAEYVGATDEEALDAFKALASSEGILCAFESAHALAHALKLAARRARRRALLVVNLSGRGDKDVAQAQRLLGAFGVSRYARCSSGWRQRGEGAFGAFLMLGDPDLETSAAPRRRGRRGRRHDRGRHPLLRSGRRRPGHPGGGAARAPGGRRVDDCFDLIAGFRDRHPDMCRSES